jgi:hypothetical protein
MVTVSALLDLCLFATLFLPLKAFFSRRKNTRKKKEREKEEENKEGKERRKDKTLVTKNLFGGSNVECDIFLK